MSRLLRMDRSGHTELAAWSAGDPRAHDRAATIFDEQLAGGYMGVAKLRDESFEQVKQLPVDVEYVLLRRPDRGRVVSAALPELEAVAWRRRYGRALAAAAGAISAGYTALYVTPLLVVAVVLLWLEPLLFRSRRWPWCTRG